MIPAQCVAFKRKLSANVPKEKRNSWEALQPAHPWNPSSAAMSLTVRLQPLLLQLPATLPSVSSHVTRSREFIPGFLLLHLCFSFVTLNNLTRSQ